MKRVIFFCIVIAISVIAIFYVTQRQLCKIPQQHKNYSGVQSTTTDSVKRLSASDLRVYDLYTFFGIKRWHKLLPKDILNYSKIEIVLCADGKEQVLIYSTLNNASDSSWPIPATEVSVIMQETDENNTSLMIITTINTEKSNVSWSNKSCIKRNFSNYVLFGANSTSCVPETWKTLTILAAHEKDGHLYTDEANYKKNAATLFLRLIPKQTK